MVESRLFVISIILCELAWIVCADYFIILTLESTR